VTIVLYCTGTVYINRFDHVRSPIEESFTPVRLCHPAVQFDTCQRATMPCGWEGIGTPCRK